LGASDSITRDGDLAKLANIKKEKSKAREEIIFGKHPIRRRDSDMLDYHLHLLIFYP
jgi:hypothetical protein